MLKAVITSDLMQSSLMDKDVRMAMNEQIKELLHFLNEQANPRLERYEFFRGDSVQCLVSTADALRMALLIKTGVRSLAVPMNKSVAESDKDKTDLADVRVSLAIGKIQIQAPELALSDGEAYQLSGRRLDEMKKEKRSFSIVTPDAHAEELETEAFLLDVLLQKTTAMQCQVFFWKILGLSETAIADKLGVNQSAVNQRSTAGGWHAIHQMIKRFEQLYM